MLKRFALLSLIAALFAGCSAVRIVLPSVPPPAGPVSQPTGGICYALTDAEVTAATHRQPMLSGIGYESGGLRVCTWSLWLDPVESVNLTLSRPAAFAEGRFGGEETIPGVGSDAYWSDGLDMLTVATPKGTLTVLVWSEQVDTRTAAIQLGKLAAPRL